MNKRELGLDELATLKEMWKRWLQRDIIWATDVVFKQNGQSHDGEWDYLLGEWKENFDEWMYPYVRRMYETECITVEDAGEFVAFAYTLMNTALDAIRMLEVPTNEKS
jgi:hypothetical protein